MPTQSFDRRTWAVAAAASICFALALWLGGPGNRVDERLLVWLSGERALHPWLTGFGIGLTQLGCAPAVLLMAAAAALLLVVADRWRPALSLMAVVLGGRAIVELLKLAIHRPRPLLLPYPVPIASLSFPSAHSANSMITFLALALIVAPARIRTQAVAAALAASVAVGMTRPLLGVHWPSDVIGGWSFGIAWVAATMVLVRRLGGTAE